MRLSDAPVRLPVSDVHVVAFDVSGPHRRPDRLVTEEPMEIRVLAPTGREPISGVLDYNAVVEVVRAP